MRWLAACLMVASPALAQADAVESLGWPGLYAVQNVAADDRLNVRAAPNAKSEILGHFARDASGIEVIGVDAQTGRWARVNIGEQAGWVNMRFLNVPRVTNRPPASFTCFGTEPFWAFTDRTDLGYRFQFPDAEAIFFSPLERETSQNTPNRLFVTGRGSSEWVGAVIRAESCSDGMSDREFGMAIDLGIMRGDDAIFLSGCCSVAP